MAMYQNMLVVIDPIRTTNPHYGEQFICINGLAAKLKLSCLFTISRMR